MINSSDDIDQTNLKLSRDLDQNTSGAVSKVTDRADQMMSIVHQGTVMPQRGELLRGIPEALKGAMIRGQTEVIQIELEQFKKSLLEIRNSELEVIRISCKDQITKARASSLIEIERVLSTKVDPLLADLDEKLQDLDTSLVDKVDVLSKKISSASNQQSASARELLLKAFEKSLAAVEREYNKEHERILARKKAIRERVSHLADE